MIVKLRELPDDLRTLYSERHDHTRWQDHILRVNSTIALTKWFAGGVPPLGIMCSISAADLSCGDGAILNALDLPTKFYGDFVPGYPLCGKIEDTLTDLPPVDLFLCCETLEHVAAPLAVLKGIRQKAKRLILTTPIGIGEDANREHLWSWDVEGVEELLKQSEWTVKVRQEIRFFTWAYDWQIWGCV